MPVYYSGLLLIIIFSIWLRWFPSGGMHTLGKDFSIIDSLRHLFLPVLSLSTLIAAKYVRFLRTSMLEVIHQDYIRTAAAKGLHNRVIIYKHAFRNAAIPLVTVVAIDLPVMFAGALFTETVYSWPGMGRLFVDSATRFDYSIVMGIVAASLGVADAIISESGLSFLGLGIQPPTATWGNMLKNALDQIFAAPWTAIIPGFMIFLTVLSINYIGDGLRDAFDPHKIL